MPGPPSPLARNDLAPAVGAAVLLGAAVALGGFSGERFAADAAPTAGTSAAATPATAAPVATPAASPFVVVEIVGRDYDPKAITIEPGTTVYWVNRDGNAHTASAVDGAFESGNLSAGAVFETSFDEPGSYPYDCRYHHDMGGTVIVLGD